MPGEATLNYWNAWKPFGAGGAYKAPQTS